MRTSKTAQSKTRTKRPLAGPTLVPWTLQDGEEIERAVRGRYGVVRITGGRFKGHLGLYDDDEGADAFVYPRGLPPTPYIVCRHASLAKAREDEVALWWAVNTNQIASRIAVRDFRRQHERGE